MGIQTGGAFGILRGKTSGLNFRYAGGNNVVSKYVPNPRNPQTPAQVNARECFRFISKMFQQLEPQFLAIGYNKKTIYKKQTGLAIQQLYADNGVLDMSGVPAHNWLLHQWRIIVDTIRGRGDERLINPQPIIGNSLLFDLLKLNPTKQDDDQIVCIWVGLNNRNIMRPLPGFVSVWERENNATMPFGVSLCFDTGTPWDMDSDQYVEDSECYVNVSGIWGNLMYSVPPNTTFSDIIDSINTKIASFGSNILALRSFGDDIILNMPLDVSNNTKMSGIQRSSGINLQIASFTDQPETLDINWNLLVAKADFTISVAFNVNKYDYSFLFTGVIPDDFSTDHWHLEFHYFKYNAGGVPTRVIITGANDTALLEGSIEDLQALEHVRGLLFLVINDKCYSSPIRVFSRPNTDFAWMKLNYVWHNECPFRVPDFFAANSCICKVLDNIAETHYPVSGVTVELFDADDNSITSEVTNDIGYCSFSLDDNVYIKKLTATLDARTIDYDVQKTYKTGRCFDLGKIMLPAAP